MKSHLATIVIALCAGCLGGISSHFFLSGSAPVEQTQAEQGTELSRAFPAQTEAGEVTLQITQLQQKTDWLEMQFNEIVHTQSNSKDSTENTVLAPVDNKVRQRAPVIPNKDNLVYAGVDPDIADDILRRISQQEFRRLELQNLIQRNASSETQQYRNELRELKQNKISLRAELGDDAYDRYLVESGQNNRMKVTSVMAESPAELNGIQKEDVILYYDENRIFNWSELREATLDGEIGSYTNVVIFRDGQRMSLIVPRGTLGVQLEAVQLDPAEER